MLGFDVKTIDTTSAVKKAADEAGFKSVGHAAAAIRKDAIASIKPADGEPSAPGTPPHTQTAKVTKSGRTKKGRLPRSIVFAVDKPQQLAVVGPRHSVIGDAGAAHEFGETLGATDFDERPFMGPALENNLDRFLGLYADQFGG